MRRFAVFNAVGMLGVGVQLGALALLTATGVDYLLATVLAVEAAVLHNFAWHERWTWRDRPAASPADRLGRLLRFHLANGLVSLAGNLLLMSVLVGSLALPVVPANLLAITLLAMVNFFLGDRLVFAPHNRFHNPGAAPQARRSASRY